LRVVHPRDNAGYASSSSSSCSEISEEEKE